MTFQFKCPNGCLLEGEESQAGETITCPVCNQAFIIPAPLGQEPEEAAEQQPVVTDEPEEEEIQLVHIPCPNGHMLETPPEMFGQEVLCPHCNAQFQLREADSVEFKRKRDIERRRRDERIGNAWLNWAVVIAVVVILGLLGLIFASSQS